MLLNSILYYFHWFVIFIFNTFISLYVTLSDLGSSLHGDIGSEYDYIIVGGGSAGAVIALRLSENQNVSVLLLEAGAATPDILNIPVLGPLKQTSDLDWQYKTIPQEHSCYGLKNNSSVWPSGKVLGGTTHLNYMVYLKGHENDFKSWTDPETNDWSIDDVEYYFNKAVECNPHIQSKRCSEDGNLLVREAAFTTDFGSAVLRASSEIGYEITDLNSSGKCGFMIPQVNIDSHGKRWTADQKLRKVLTRRKNLTVQTNVVVQRILIRNRYEAYAVEYRLSRKIRTVNAREEIILSAGTVGSAKILMLSGIGPKPVLAKAKVKQLVDLPVGKNLQDHITTGLDLILLVKELFSINHLTNPMSAYEYFVKGKGPYTSNVVEAVGLVHTDEDEGGSPDLELMAMVAGTSSDGGLFSRHSMGISDSLWEEYFSLLTNTSAATILPVLLHPKSVGEVELNPEDPLGPPLINPRYLSDQDDVKTLIRGIRLVQRLVNTKAMNEFGARFNNITLPGCEKLHFDSDDYWDCYVRHLTLTTYHPVGTCRMGIDENVSVVDHRLRVHKTNKLRIIDASVMPTMPSANTNAAVIMIAEKGSDLIKEDYNRRRSCSSVREILFLDKKCESRCNFSIK
ncbi:UNVERIFIED_CONTAM: hypothetical protein PYX00_001788 [Menopon gallinae]|uniref:Glucose dehydrogenase n=1 Tax=Menopon gallinae TaxID=328185 RepID=A0AAW2IEE8_9NEOP